MDSQERPNKSRPNDQWKDALALFLGGASVHQISEKLAIPLGSVKARAYRDRWVEVRNRAKPLAAEIRMTTTRAFLEGRNDGMEERGRKLRQNLSKAIHDQLERLPSYAPETLRDELDIGVVLKNASGVAATVHGWDRESVTSTVRVGAMGGLDEPGDGEMPVVDVGPTSD